MSISERLKRLHFILGEMSWSKYNFKRNVYSIFFNYHYIRVETAQGTRKLAIYMSNQILIGNTLHSAVYSDDDSNSIFELSFLSDKLYNINLKIPAKDIDLAILEIENIAENDYKDFLIIKSKYDIEIDYLTKEYITELF